MIVGTTVQTDIVGITVVIIVGWEIPNLNILYKICFCA